MANDKEDIEYMARKLQEEYRRWGLEINVQKTKYLPIGTDRSNIQLGNGDIITFCNEYTYLGYTFDYTGRDDNEIKKGVTQARKTIGCLNGILWSQDIGKQRKYMIYDTLIKSSLMYGAETWQLTENNNRKLEAVEMDVFRRSLGISRRYRIHNEEILVLVCLTFKRVTDDEASRVFLYLQKLSREWSLLNNITWSRVGAALADATYGGYLIITFALFIGRMFGELPTRKRITEYILLGIGTILFVVLGSLSFAALDSVPHDLVDNAAIVGTVSLVTAGLFLLDIGGPRAKELATEHKVRNSKNTKNDRKPITQQVYDVERQINSSDKKDLDAFEKVKKNNKDMNGIKTGTKNGIKTENGIEMELPKSFKGYQQMKNEDFPQRYGIYGKDVVDTGNETDETEEMQMPPRMEPHSPVWSHIRKGIFGKPEIVSSPLVIPRQQQEDVRQPNRPGDPGYVQYTAQHWGETAPKTPRHSPTEV